MAFRVLLAAALLVSGGRVPLKADDAANGMTISGDVFDALERPVVNAQVLLLRHSVRLDAEGVEILAHGATDSRGHFSLGDVAVRAELEFPVETGVSLEFIVMTNNVRRTLDIVQFTAPRAASAVKSVAAEIHVH